MDYTFVKGQFTEAQLEQAIIALFEQQEYTYVHGESIHRKYEDILLLDQTISAYRAKFRIHAYSVPTIYNGIVI